MKKSVMKNIKNVWERMKQTIRNQDGMSVVELILVLVVIIGLVLIFKTQLTNLVETIFAKITSESAGQLCGYRKSDSYGYYN